MTITLVEEDSELLLTFSEEMLKELNWNIGDTLVWSITETSGQVFVCKKGYKPS